VSGCATVVSLEPSSCSHVTWCGEAWNPARSGQWWLQQTSRPRGMHSARIFYSQALAPAPGSRPSDASKRGAYCATHLKRLVLGVLTRHSQAKRQPPHTDACFERSTGRTSQACGGGGVGRVFLCARYILPPGSHYFHPPGGRCRVTRAGASRTEGVRCLGPMKQAARPSSTAVHNS
jgi:hypothetical protein